MEAEVEVAKARIITLLSPLYDSDLIEIVHFWTHLSEAAIRHAMWRLIAENVISLGNNRGLTLSVGVEKQ